MVTLMRFKYAKYWVIGLIDKVKKEMILSSTTQHNN